MNIIVATHLPTHQGTGPYIKSWEQKYADHTDNSIYRPSWQGSKMQNMIIYSKKFIDGDLMLLKLPRPWWHTFCCSNVHFIAPGSLLEHALRLVLICVIKRLETQALTHGTVHMDVPIRPLPPLHLYPVPTGGLKLKAYTRQESYKEKKW